MKSGSEPEPELTVLTDLEGELSFLPFGSLDCFFSAALVPDLLELLTVGVDF